MTNADVAILIPAYKPDERMVPLICALREKGFERIYVVDDGGGEAFRPLFDEAQKMGARVLSHPENRGKGAALKTGLSQIISEGACPVITADADGQHTPEDICAVASAMAEAPEALVLGTRDKKQMPPRSRMGNTITCAVLGLLSGLWIDDTQTGLRGIPAQALKQFARLEGERYEYEMNMLLRARETRMKVVQVVIHTVYFDNNQGSHFKTVRDSARIYALLFRRIARYIGSSAVSGVVDFGLFTLLHVLVPDILIVPVVGARVISALINYLINREVVFKSRAGRQSLGAFYLLVAVVMMLSYLIIRLLTGLGVPTLVAKVLADGILFVLSYNVQHRWIFRDRVDSEA